MAVSQNDMIDRPRFVVEVRQAAISVMVGLAGAFLVNLSQRNLFPLAIYAWSGLTGLSIFAACTLLGRLLGRRFRKLPHWRAKAALGATYFLGGCLGWWAAFVVARATGLIHFEVPGRDVLRYLAMAGGIAIAVGAAFASFDTLTDRLRESAVRLKEREFAEKELEVARSIQHRLLPPPELEGPGYRVAARNLAAHFVAGDFYDVFPLSEGSVGLALADVSGKGMGASLIMASVKSALPLVAAGRSVPATLDALNRKLSDELRPREFVALAYARFDPAIRRLSLGNAGLPDPYLLGLRGRVRELSVEGCRLPLGARRDAAYGALDLTLEPGERVIFFTDGLPEAPTASGEPLGYERIEAFIGSPDGRAAPPLVFVDSLFARVREHSTPTLADDWTALLFEAE